MKERVEKVEKKMIFVNWKQKSDPTEWKSLQQSKSLFTQFSAPAAPTATEMRGKGKLQ